MQKRLLSLLLSAALVITGLDMPTVFAAEESIQTEQTLSEQESETVQQSEEDSAQQESHSTSLSEETATEPEEMMTALQTDTESESTETVTESQKEEETTTQQTESNSSEQQTEENTSKSQTETESSVTEQESETLTEELTSETTETATEELTEFATEEQKISDASEMQFEIYVNPLYRDIIDPDELSQQLNSLQVKSQNSVKSTAQSFQTFDAAAAYLKEQMVARETTVSVQVPISVSEANKGAEGFHITLLNAAMEHTEECSGQEGDALKWQYGGSTMSMSSNPNTNTYTVTYTISYYTTLTQEQELTTKVNEALDRLALSGKTDYQKVKAIHDYICDTTDYDYANLGNDAYKIQFTAYGALCTGKAVCQGYAVAFYRMCKEAGLPVRIITGIGNGGSHAWNIVKIGDNSRGTGAYYNIDCTWDGQDAETHHTYFLLNEKDFVDHTRNPEYNTSEFHTKYPMSETSYVDESSLPTGLNKENPSATFTTIDDKTVTSTADGKPKILIFFQTACTNSQNTIRAIAGNEFTNVDIYAAEIYARSKEDVTSFKNTYANDTITFLYDTEFLYGTTTQIGSDMFQYAKEAGLTDGSSMSVALPMICYIDANNMLQHVTQGKQNASEVEVNLKNYCSAAPVKQYKITYELNGGTNHNENPTVFKENSDTILLKDPTKTGFTFAGWYLDAAMTQKVTQIERGTASDITLYAKWSSSGASDKLNLDNLDIIFTGLNDEDVSSKANGKPKLIIFFSHNCQKSQNTIRGIRQGLDNVDILAIDTIKSSKTDVQNFKNTYGSDAITFSYDDYGVENNGYLGRYVDLSGVDNYSTVVICYIDANNKFQHITFGTSSASQIKTNLDLYCNGTSSEDPVPTDSYTITYELDGGTNNTDNPSTYMQTTETITLQAPTKEGYTFGGWYRDAAFTLPITQIVKGSSGNLTLYAKWESSSDFPEVEITCKEGNIVVGISGAYVTETAETILNRLNEIRLEACKEGVIDPWTKRAFTEADYRPLKWSSDLEAIARLRAVEASVRLEHTRPNGASCFSAVTTNGEQSWGENLAWNYDNLMKGIEQWYGEKSDWVNKTGKVTGHYESIISSRYHYVAVGGFKLEKGAIYPVTVAQEFSDHPVMDSQKSDIIGNCVQDMEIVASAVSKLEFDTKSPLRIEAGNSFPLVLNATVGFEAYGKKTATTGPVREGGIWNSSDSTVASVDAKGNITALKSGTTTIRVSAGTLSTEITVEVFNAGENPLHLTPPTKTTYKIGEQLDLKGGTITVDGKSTALTAKMVSGFSSENAGVIKITVVHNGYTANFDVLIVEEPKLNAKYGQTLSQLTLPTNEYGTWSWAETDLQKKLEEVGIFQFKVTFTPKDLNTFQKREDLQAEVSVNRSLEEMGITAKLHTNSFVYNGAYQEPDVSVLAGEQILKRDEDYTLRYENNKNAGMALAIIEGKGSYNGNLIQTFEIKPAKLTIRAKDVTALSNNIPTEFAYETIGLALGESLIQEPRFYHTAPTLSKSGVYEIIPSNAKASINYDPNITYINGRLVLSEETVAYVVTFDMQGHGTQTETFVGKAGSVVTEPTKPTEEGYQFVNWYQDVACTKAWDFAADTLQSDITLYAKWLIKNDQSKFCIQEIPDIYYTGKPCKPTVTVYDGSTPLKVNKDYTISYSNNTNVNTISKRGIGIGNDFDENLPYVTIIGKGNYTEKLTANFNIKPASLANTQGNPVSGVTLKYKDQIAVSSNKTANPFQSIKYGKVLKQGKDFELSIQNADTLESIAQNGIIPAGMTGRFILEIKGINNYSGAIRKTVYVLEQAKLIKNAKITLGKNIKTVELKKYREDHKDITFNAAYYDKTTKNYYRVQDGKPIFDIALTSEEQKDYFTVTCGGESLIYQKDFTVAYTHNDRAGTASLTIIGTGGQYAGEKTITFKIKGESFKANLIEMEQFHSEMDYTGTAITQNDVKLSVKNDGTPLYYGKDYTISYKKNINKGTATMTFKAMEGSLYSGSFNKTFKILPADLANLNKDASMANIKVPYEKSGVKPADKILLRNPAGTILQYNKDFTVRYQNNKVAEKADGKTPTMTVKGKGNYTGSITVEFTIEKSSLDRNENKNITIEITPIAYNEQKAQDYAYKPAVKIKDGKSTLKYLTDYTLEYKNNTQNICSSFIEQGLSAPLETKPYVIITPTEGGNYDSTEPVTVPLPIYRTKLTANTLYTVIPNTESTQYTGKSVEPKILVYYNSDTKAVSEAKNKLKSGTPLSDATLKSQGFQLLKAETEYTCTYGANISAGKNKGSITIRGVAPNYGSQITVKFDIIKKNVSW